MLRLFMVALCLAVPTYGYSAGAPQNVCLNGLTPEHHVDPQAGRMPYSLSGANGVKAGSKVSLTLGGGNFLGFAMQAHDANKQPIGQFKVVETGKSQTLDCSGKGDTLTHKKIPRDSPINRLDFEWIAPANYEGKVQFVSTVAKNGGTYWIGQVLKTIDVVNV